MIVSDAPNCGITYDHHYDNRNSFIIQATDMPALGCGVLSILNNPFISKRKVDTFN